MIDYSLPSTLPRLWVFDVERGRLLFEELVAHGRNTGERVAERFSNVEGSKMSSLGLFRTADTYYGSNGYSLRTLTFTGSTTFTSLSGLRLETRYAVPAQLAAAGAGVVCSLLAVRI